VASSNAAGLAQQVGDGGILFDPRDELAMEEAMCRLAGDAELRRELSERGWRRAAGAGLQSFASTLGLVYAHAAATHRTRKAA
jgi:glycosyltransferase involved in cell wall biosynthesis